MKTYFDTQIAPKAEKLKQLIGDERVNDPSSWTDRKGITHIYVFDRNQEFKLVDGEWQEQPPF